MGYKIITFPVSLLFAQTANLLKLLRYVKENGTDEGFQGDFISFADYLKFIGADYYRDIYAKYIDKYLD